MKTELQIAKENIKQFKNYERADWDFMKGHKKTCKRWLSFLQVQMADFMNLNGTCHTIMINKINDLQDTLVEYGKVLETDGGLSS